MIKNVVSKVKVNGKKVRSSAMVLFATLTLAANQAFAAPSTGAEFYNSAMQLANDACSWILGLIPVVGGGAIGFQALMKMLNQDPAEVAHRNKNMKNILVAALIGECAAGIVKAVLVYFGH